MKTETPLVSIIVITYNSSKYVLETLESIKSQTYKNIELIISDDCSTDDTVEICNKWLVDNENLGFRIEIITTAVNTGIPANCNRGVNAAKGEWIKLIAGDDLLTPDCIDEFVMFSRQNPKAVFIASNMLALQVNKIQEKIVIDPFMIKGSAKRQLQMLCKFYTFIPGPSIFMNKDKLIELGGYEEKYRLVEDFPFLFKAMKSGYRIFHLDKELVVYRKHESSISRGTTDKLKPVFDLFFNSELYPYIKKNNYFLHRHYYLEGKLEQWKSPVLKFILSQYIKISDPFYWYFNFHRFLHKRKRWNAIHIHSLTTSDIFH